MGSITSEQYVARNLQGFEGDTFMKSEFERLIAKHKIDLIIETGTFKGGTTNQLRKMVKEVITIEINSEYFAEAKKNISDLTNVIMIHGSSPEVLDTILPAQSEKNIMLFLDGHWLDNCPLLEELRIIAEHGIKPVIAIHDFYVPGTNFGYDSYNGQRFDFAYIINEVSAIYKGGFHHHYNLQATGAKRGIIYLEPTNEK